MVRSTDHHSPRRLRLADWSRWRKIRDSNNRSVKRSREKARERSSHIETENKELMSTISTLRTKLKEARQLAHKAYTARAKLSAHDVHLIESFARE